MHMAELTEVALAVDANLKSQCSFSLVVSFLSNLATHLREMEVFPTILSRHLYVFVDFF